MAGETAWVGGALRVPGPADAEKWGGGLPGAFCTHERKIFPGERRSGDEFEHFEVFAQRGFINNSERETGSARWWRSSADRHEAFTLL
jgi:hypothetical protein